MTLRTRVWTGFVSLNFIHVRVKSGVKSKGSVEETCSSGSSPSATGLVKVVEFDFSTSDKYQHVKGGFKNNILLLTVFDLQSAFSEKLRGLS